MARRGKVELFEQIRREYGHGVGTIQGVAKRLGVHRRMVRQALRFRQLPRPLGWGFLNPAGALVRRVDAVRLHNTGYRASPPRWLPPWHMSVLCSSA